VRLLPHLASPALGNAMRQKAGKSKPEPSIRSEAVSEATLGYAQNACYNWRG
jgi:hypothetical protein